MKDSTKVRLHLSKQLFESLTREIIKEAKANGGGAYTEVVKQHKMPKQSKSQATSPEVQKTDAESMMGEVHAQADTKKMKKMEEKMSSKEKMAKGLYNEDEMDEMQMNVAEKDKMNEMADVSWEAVAAGMAAMGLAPLAIEKIHQWWEKKYPKSFKKAQGVSGAMSNQGVGLNELRKKAKK